MTSSFDATQTRAAIAAIIISVAALSLGDAVIKASGLALPLWQMFVLRSALVVPVLWWLSRRRGPLRVQSTYWVLVRSILLVCTWLSYYLALPYMPLSLAAAAYYSGPLFIVALAALAARRMPSARASLAITFGFAGVLLVIRPETSGLSLVTLLPIFAALLYACAMVLTSAKCSEDDPTVLALALNATFIVGGLVLGLFAGREGSFILGPWQALDLPLLGTVSALAVLILIGSVGAAFAYQKGTPAKIAAFDYSYLVFSLVWGGLFFSEAPGMIEVTGILMVAAAGLLAATES